MPKKLTTIPILSALCLITFGLLILQDYRAPSRFSGYLIRFQNRSFLQSVKDLMPLAEENNSLKEPDVLVEYNCHDSNIPCNFSFLINHPSQCSRRTQHLFVVISSPSNVKSRDAIRDTWGGYALKKYDAALIFLVGVPGDNDRLQAMIEDEDAVHGDMVQGNFLDTYKNLSIKTVGMLRWHMAFCPQAKYVLKVDDDIFINVDALLGALNFRIDGPIILGLLAHGWRPIRNRESKWYLSSEEFGERSYPDFVAGPTYVISRDAVGPLYETSLTVRRIPLEDVYLTGLVAEKARVPRVHFEGMRNLKSPLSKIATGYNSHQHSPSELRLLWRRLVKKW